MAMTRIREVAIERIDADGPSVRTAIASSSRRRSQLRARGAPVATIMRTPGHDLELVRGLLHAESVAARRDRAGRRGRGRASTSMPAAFAGRGLLATAACGVCGRVAIADLELRAREVDRRYRRSRARVLAALPARLRAAQAVFDDTGGLHAAGLFTTRRARWSRRARTSVATTRSTSSSAGRSAPGSIRPAHVLFLSGRAGYELVQKAIMLGVPIVASVSAPSSLAIELAERFNVALVGFVRGRPLQRLQPRLADP